jgi:hypothetical protein
MNLESESESHSPAVRIYYKNGLAAVLLIASEISRQSPPSGIGRAIANAGTSKTRQIRTNHEEEPPKRTHHLSHLPTICSVAVHFRDSTGRDTELDE